MLHCVPTATQASTLSSHTEGGRRGFHVHLTLSSQRSLLQLSETQGKAVAKLTQARLLWIDP